jgi:hypothetical protein
LLGDYAKAEPLFRRSLAILEKALGPDHPSVATSLENLAALYRQVAKLEVYMGQNRHRPENPPEQRLLFQWLR